MSKSRKETRAYSRLTKSSFIELKKDTKVIQKAHYYDGLEDIIYPKWNHIDPDSIIKEANKLSEEVKEMIFCTHLVYLKLL